MTTTSLTCLSCGTVCQVTNGHVGREERCVKCYADLHSCRHCDFHDVSAYNECREPAADRVKDKDKSNFCDFFRIRQGGGRAQNSAQDLKARAEALFKNMNKK